MSLQGKKLFLFDIDGTIALGDTLLQGSRELFGYIDSIGGKSIFTTNNSTKSQKAYVEKFRRWGLRAGEEQFVTSSYISCLYLKQHFPQELVFALGTASFVEELRQHGLHVTETPEPGIGCVVVGYDDELTYRKLVNTCEVLEGREVPYFATNPDLRCPTPFGFVPDCGAICHMLQDATDKTPTFLGKPNPYLVEVCLQQTGFTKDQTVVVGDRLYTDIACGLHAQVDTCLLFTGEAQPDDLSHTSFPPTWSFSSIWDLYQCLLGA